MNQGRPAHRLAYDPGSVDAAGAAELQPETALHAVASQILRSADMVLNVVQTQRRRLDGTYAPPPTELPKEPLQWGLLQQLEASEKKLQAVLLEQDQMGTLL